LACFLAIAACAAGFADEWTPFESDASLGDTFVRLRDELWALDDVFWHQGEYDHCIATLRMITLVDPSDCQAYDNEAWLLQNDFKDDEAESVLREGLRNNPDSYEMYFNLGHFLYMHQRYEDAVEVLETAVTFDCPFFVHNMLAHAHELAGRPGEALNIWLEQEAMQEDSGVPELQIDRILSGGEPSQIPATIQRWRADRKARSN